MENAGDHEITVNHCPECSGAIDVSSLPPYAKIECPLCQKAIRVRTLLGNFQITQLLGEGGMSQVFRAWDQTLAREVALKILHQQLSKDAALTSMFEREAKLTAAIQHPNVVKVYTVGHDQTYFYIAMELVDATSLEGLIAQEGKIPEKTVLEIASDVTSGLRAAHKANLIHRDIKPGNMLVTDEGTAKLVDFGLAVQQGGADESEDLWATPFYVPPEKLDGEQDTFLGDLYSLGATLFHAIAGQPPFAANTSSLDELKKIKAASISLKDFAPEASKRTIKLVDKMMSHNPAKRHASYDELLSDIESIQQSEFGEKNKLGIRKGALSSLWAKAGLGALAVSGVITAIVFIASRGGDDVEANAIISGEEERVVSAAARADSQKFLEGRTLLSQGDTKKAAEIFSNLRESVDLAPSMKAWNQFFLGLVELMEGREESSRSYFGSLRDLESFAQDDPSLSEQEEFLKKAGAILDDDLPLLPSTRETLNGNSLDALALFAGGLKNWHMRQPASGIQWIQAFEEKEIPESHSWIGDMKSLTKDYFADYLVLNEKAPNPSRKMPEDELLARKAQLLKLISSLQTPETARKILRDRTKRVDEIISQERKLAELLAKKEPEKQNAPPPKAEPEIIPPEMLAADKKKFVDLVTGFSIHATTYEFADAVSQLKGAEFQTTPIKEGQSALVDAYSKANEFLPIFASRLVSTEYVGSDIERRTGSPLHAKITGGDHSHLMIDLGFGANRIDMKDFSPKWILRASQQVLPTTDEAKPDWEKLLWFTMACGLKEEGQSLLRKLNSMNAEFGGQLSTQYKKIESALKVESL